MQTVTITLQAEFELPDADEADYYDTPEGIVEWFSEEMRDSKECKRVISRVDHRPLPPEDPRMFPVDVQAAIDFLADYAVQRERKINAPEDCDEEMYDKLGSWVAMAISVQIEEPDYEQADMLILTEEADR